MYKKTMITAVVSAVFASAVHGQEEPKLEEVVVTGVRAALENALESKRNADSIMDGISADDIGSFPDLNLAESLQRVTGVQMDYAGDEGERRQGRVAIRGLPVNFSLTTYNGQLLAAPRPDVGFGFGNVESSVISAVNVIKTPTARMDEGGLAGTIDIRTLRALDIKDDYARVGVKQTYETLTDEWSPNYSLAFGKTFSDGRWGLVGSLSAGEQSFRGDVVRVNRYASSDTNGDGLADRYVPSEIRVLSRYTTGDRVSATLGFDFQATDNLRFGLNGIYIEDPINHDWAQFRMRRAKSLEILESVTSSTFGDTVTRVNFVNPELQLEQRLISEENITQAVTADFEWENTDWSIKGVIHHSEASQFAYGNMARRVLKSANNNGVSVLVDTGGGNVGNFELLEANNVLADPSTYSYGSCTAAEIAAGKSESACANSSSGAGDWYATYTSGHEFDVTDEDRAVQLDVTRYFEGSAVSSVSVGLKQRQTNQSFVRPEWALPNSLVDFSQIPDSGSLTSFGQFTSTNGFFDGRFGGQIDNFYFQNVKATDLALVSGQTFPGPTLAGLPEPADGGDIASTYSDSERDVFSAYGMIEFDLSELSAAIPVRGNVGVRYVDTDRKVKAFRDTNGDLELITAATSFSDVLPSVNLIWDIRDDLILRASYSETIVRPHAWNFKVGQAIDVVESAPNVVDSIEISLGNPELLPFSADSVDFSLEWYGDQGTSMSLAYFQKEIANGFDSRVLCPANLSDISSLKGASVNDLVSGPLAVNDSGVCVDSKGVDVTISDQVNNSDTYDISGFELGILQTFDFIGIPFISDMGVQANYTYVDTSEGPDKDASGNSLPLAGVSEDTYNLIAFYDGEQVGVRLAYTRRSDYFDETVFTVSGDNRFIEAPNRLDMQISYNPKQFENLFLTLEAFNLTDEQFTAYQGVSSRFREGREVGRTLSLQAQYKF